MATNPIPKPINEAELWKTPLDTWSGWVPAPKLRFGYDTSTSRVILEAAFSDGDIRRIAWNTTTMVYSMRHNNTWSTVATWNKTS